MKKIFLTVLCLFCFAGSAFADTIYNKDKEIKCKVEGVTGGLISAAVNGNLMSFKRSKENPVFKDYVEARKFLFSREIIKYTGRVEYADNARVKILQDGVLITVPRYKVVNISVFIP